MADRRHRRCMERLASEFPLLRPVDLDRAVKAVLGEADQDWAEREAVALDAGDYDVMPADLNDWDWTPVEDVVPGNAIWDDEQRCWVPVAANPPVHFDDEVLVTYEGGDVASFERGLLVRVAHDTVAAMGWNRRHAAVELVDPEGWE